MVLGRRESPRCWLLVPDQLTVSLRMRERVHYAFLFEPSVFPSTGLTAASAEITGRTNSRTRSESGAIASPRRCAVRASGCGTQIMIRRRPTTAAGPVTDPISRFASGKHEIRGAFRSYTSVTMITRAPRAHRSLQRPVRAFLPRVLDTHLPFRRAMDYLEQLVVES